MYIEKCIIQSPKLFFSFPPSKNYLFFAYSLALSLQVSRLFRVCRSATSS